MQTHHKAVDGSDNFTIPLARVYILGIVRSVHHTPRRTTTPFGFYIPQLAINFTSISKKAQFRLYSELIRAYDSRAEVRQTFGDLGLRQILYTLDDYIRDFVETRFQVL